MAFKFDFDRINCYV